MRKGLFAVILFSLISSSTPAALAVIKPGSSCKISNQKIKFKNKTFTCIKSGKRLVWSKGTVPVSSGSLPNPAAKSVMNFAEPEIPSNFDFSGGKHLAMNISIETNLVLDLPVAVLQFKVPSGEWSVPSQTRTIKGAVTQVSKNDSKTIFKIEFYLTEFDPIGSYKIMIDPLTTGSKLIDLPNNSQRIYPLTLTRTFWKKGDVTQISPRSSYEYISFKNEKLSRIPWVGRNVTLLTYSPNLDPNVMSRILNALDVAYDSYAEITEFTPGIARAYEGKLSIAEMTPETVGCGAACGYLGATGIEIQTQLFMRLYNGVKLHDQFDEPLFYELGRNFWNYGSYREVLVGSTGSSKWFDINTTGFAVFMRYFVTEVNSIPIGPNDGPNKPGLEFKNDMLNLMITQRESTTDNFSSTFLSSKFSGYGFGVYGFWSSLIYYFMPSQDKQGYVRRFLINLKNQDSPKTVSQSINNVVNSIGNSLGRDISRDFYLDLHFEDSKKL